MVLLGLVADLVLGGVADQSLVLVEGHLGGGGPVALVVGNDGNLAVFPDADAGVGRAQVNTDCGSLRSHWVWLRMFVLLFLLCYEL